jgi:hypothetical protein
MMNAKIIENPIFTIFTGTGDYADQSILKFGQYDMSALKEIKVPLTLRTVSVESWALSMSSMTINHIGENLK